MMAETGRISEKVRLDKWLWAARFFKTRSLAADAVSGGKVHVNDARAKPARSVQIGDVLSIRRGPYEYVVAVRGLCDRRGPAKQAVLLYEETPESAEKRALVAAQMKSQVLEVPHPDHRPNKRDRRRIIRFTRTD
jgi:ribosome-associated heat shock protein Hsp15